MVRKNHPVIVLLGPTGSGKSSVAIKLSEQLPIEIICMDSMQVYSELSIGNTAPSEKEREKVAHHLFGSVSIRNEYSSVHWLHDALQVIKEIHGRGNIPVFVGGTGLYFQILTEGISEVPKTPKDLRHRLDQRCDEKGLSSLYNLLARLDPDAARMVHYNDRQRVQRFLEIRILTGRSVVDLWALGRKSPIEYPILTLGLSAPRAILRRRIRDRLNEMLCSGWLDEVIELGKNGLRHAVEKRGPLGYQILFRMLDGDFPLFNEAIERIDIATRRYAKRQMTWFQNISEIEWVHLQDDLGYNLEQIFAVVLEFIKNESYIH